MKLQPQSPSAGSPAETHAGEAQHAGFPKKTRLLKHSDCERVYKTGRRHFGTLMTVFFVGRAGGGSPRVGFTVSRAMGGAVERNRIKRRLREAVRLQLAAFPVSADVVINSKKSALQAEFADLQKEIASAFAAIAKKLTAKESRGGEQ